MRQNCTKTAAILYSVGVFGLLFAVFLSSSFSVRFLKLRFCPKVFLCRFISQFCTICSNTLQNRHKRDKCCIVVLKMKKRSIFSFFMKSFKKIDCSFKKSLVSRINIWFLKMVVFQLHKYEVRGLFRAFCFKKFQISLLKKCCCFNPRLLRWIQ